MPRVGFEPTIPCVRAGEESSCLRLRGLCDRRFVGLTREIILQGLSAKLRDF
jgi:hypothetical protein